MIKAQLLNSKQQKRLLTIARATLENYLKAKEIPNLENKDQLLNQKLGVFVTLKKKGNLRGCIGQFTTEKPLFKLVQKTAINSAINDPRFPAVECVELSEIKIEISVLSPFKKIKDWRQIRLGKDGVLIRKGQKSGTFLPQVATETGGDLKEFLASLCRKANLRKDCYKDPKTEIFTYTTQVFSDE